MPKQASTKLLGMSERIALKFPQKLNKFSIFFDEAERCHGLLSYFKPELARTKFLKSQFLRSIGSEDADKLYDEATSLFKDIRRKTAKDAVLSAEDFDNIVFIWSR